MDFLRGLAVAVLGLLMVWLETESPLVVLLGIGIAFCGALIMLDETLREAHSIIRSWPRKGGKQ